MSRRDRTVPVPPEAIAHLRVADPVMGSLVEALGPIQRGHEPDLWWALVDAIGSQQLSVKAAATILGRLHALGSDGYAPRPEEVLALPEEELRAAGLSRAKTRYIRELAEGWLDGSLELDRLPGLADDEAIEHLTRIKGVGRWTAEMVLIFSLGRPDILAVDDLGLRNAVQRAYGLEQRPDRESFLALGEPWRPFRSAASLYLWRSLALPPGS